MSNFNSSLCEMYRKKVDQLMKKIYGNKDEGLATEVRMNTSFRRDFKKLAMGVLIILIAGLITQTLILNSQFQKIKEFIKTNNSQVQQK